MVIEALAIFNVLFWMVPNNALALVTFLRHIQQDVGCVSGTSGGEPPISSVWNSEGAAGARDRRRNKGLGKRLAGDDGTVARTSGPD